MEKDEDGRIELKIADNGKGIPPDIDIRNTSSLGLRLATILVEELLAGTINVNRESGTEFCISFTPR